MSASYRECKACGLPLPCLHTCHDLQHIHEGPLIWPITITSWSLQVSHKTISGAIQSRCSWDYSVKSRTSNCAQNSVLVISPTHPLPQVALTKAASLIRWVSKNHCLVARMMTGFWVRQSYGYECVYRPSSSSKEGPPGPSVSSVHFYQRMLQGEMI